jgi:pseudaminic acid cytidylyltransferase
MRIAVIPARSGSKRMPQKNIRPFHGIPILFRTVQKLLNSNLFDKIIVSTDSEIFADIAESAGVVVTTLRPSKLSDDNVGLREVMKYELELIGLNEESTEETFCILPCTPLLKIIDLKNAIEIYDSKKYDQIIAVSEFSNNIKKAFYFDSSQSLKMCSPKNLFFRTQDLEKYYFDAGQFYLSTSGKWITGKLNQMQGLVIPRLRAIDIDNEEDWNFAELVFKTENKPTDN